MNQFAYLPALITAFIPPPVIASPALTEDVFACDGAHVMYLAGDYPSIFDDQPDEQSSDADWLLEFDAAIASLVTASDLTTPLEVGSVRMVDLVADAVDLIGLADGWDGPASRGPSAQARDKFIAALEGLPPSSALPQASITSAGALLLYWDERDYFLDMEFEPDGLISMFARDKVGQTKQHAESEDLSRALEQLAQLMDTFST